MLTVDKNDLKEIEKMTTMQFRPYYIVFYWWPIDHNKQILSATFNQHQQQYTFVTNKLLKKPLVSQKIIYCIQMFLC